MKTLLLMAAVLAYAVIGEDARAKPTDFPRNEPLVTIDFPEAWTMQHMDLSLRTGTAERDIGILCESFVTGTKATKEELAQTFTQALTQSWVVDDLQITGKPQPAEETVIDGAKAFKSRVTGTIKKVEAVAVAYLIPINEDRGLVFTYWGTVEAIKKHEALIKRIIESIRRKEK